LEGAAPQRGYCCSVLKGEIPYPQIQEAFFKNFEEIG